MDRQTLTSPAGGHISPEMTCARFYAQTALCESALCANEHELIPACVYETDNAYIHCSYETWDAETTGHELFTPFSDPQERCTQTGAQSRVWGRSSAHAMRDSQLFTPRCRYLSSTKHLMKPRHHSAHFSVGCPVRAVTPAVHSAQKRAQAGTAPTCGTLLPDLSLSNPPCFIGSCKAQGGLLRMASFSKERVPSTFFTV